MGAFGLSSPVDAFDLTLRIGAVGVSISSLELLYVRRQFWPGGWLDARAQLTRSRLLSGVPFLAKPELGVSLAGVRFFAALSLVFAAGYAPVARPATVVVAGCILLLRVRSPLGVHASGAMPMVTFTSAGLAELIGSRAAIEMALAFVSAQACLCYFVAGTGKLRTPRWRDGSVMPLLASTLMWGHRREALILRSHHRLSLVLCWATIVMESAFPLVLVLPLPGVIAILAVTLGFHVANAFEMGLNSFVWAFGATYPAILWCWWWLHSTPH